MGEEFFGFINNFYSKSTPLDTSNTTPPLLVNRFLSAHRPNIRLCDKINRYSFWIPKDLYFSIIYSTLAKQNPPWGVKYVKKNKDKEDKLDFWYDSLKRYYLWSNRELKENILLIDDELKQELAIKFGYNKEECKKLGVSFTDMKIEVSKPKPKINLSNWM
jgi:hypothetical protein